MAPFLIAEDAVKLGLMPGNHDRMIEQDATEDELPGAR
jgi:hypothetical protein